MNRFILILLFILLLTPFWCSAQTFTSGEAHGDPKVQLRLDADMSDGSQVIVYYKLPITDKTQGTPSVRIVPAGQHGTPFPIDSVSASPDGLTLIVRFQGGELDITLVPEVSDPVYPRHASAFPFDKTVTQHWYKIEALAVK